MLPTPPLTFSLSHTAICFLLLFSIEHFFFFPVWGVNIVVNCLTLLMYTHTFIWTGCSCPVIVNSYSHTHLRYVYRNNWFIIIIVVLLAGIIKAYRHLILFCYYWVQKKTLPTFRRLTIIFFFCCLHLDTYDMWYS